MLEKPKELMIVCSYCERLYGKYVNNERSYFPPIKMAVKPTTRISHGICPDCYKRVMKENGYLY